MLRDSSRFVLVIPELPTCDRIDLCIVIDSSGSIRDNNPSDGSYDNWSLMLNFVVEVGVKTRRKHLPISTSETTHFAALGETCGSGLFTCITLQKSLFPSLPEVCDAWYLVIIWVTRNNTRFSDGRFLVLYFTAVFTGSVSLPDCELFRHS